MMKTIFFWDYCFAKIGKKPPLGPFYAAKLVYGLRMIMILGVLTKEFIEFYYKVALSKTSTSIIGGLLSLLVSELTEMAFKKHEPEMERAYKKLPENERKFNRILSIGSLIAAVPIMSYVRGLLH